MNFVKFLRTPFLTEHLWWLLLPSRHLHAQWTCSTPCSIVSIVKFEHVIAGWVPETNKTGLNMSLFFYCLSLCSDFKKFHHEINLFKGILYKRRVLTPKIVVSTVPKENLMIVLPYLGKLSLQIRYTINRVMKNKLPYCNLWIVFYKCRLVDFFKFFFIALFSILVFSSVWYLVSVSLFFININSVFSNILMRVLIRSVSWHFFSEDSSTKCWKVDTSFYNFLI